jgi:hypothetical protein
MSLYHVLVVAQRTAATSELIAAMVRRHERSPVRFRLLMPFPPATPRAEAQRQLAEALETMRARGLSVDGEVGFGQPLEVVFEAWDPRSWDEIIVSTLPGPLSTWLQIDLPHRVARMTGVQVTHVIAQPPRRTPVGAPPAPHQGPGVLAPLAVMGWGGHHH